MLVTHLIHILQTRFNVTLGAFSENQAQIHIFFPYELLYSFITIDYIDQGMIQNSRTKTSYSCSDYLIMTNVDFVCSFLFTLDSCQKHKAVNKF